jgi:hypothetical protein
MKLIMLRHLFKPEDQVLYDGFMYTMLIVELIMLFSTFVLESVSL